jgi:Flp pilus assembly protein TadG
MQVSPIVDSENGAGLLFRNFLIGARFHRLKSRRLILQRCAIATSHISGDCMKNAIRRRHEAGQALIITAAALLVLMGFAGLAIDMGVMRYEKRMEQTAADAAAVAGASNLTFGGVQTAAQNATGYPVIESSQVSDCTGATVGTVCVQVNNPPETGPHAGDNSYVEALVAVAQPTYFMKALSINSETIQARAVATNLAGDGCLYTLAPPGPNAGIDLNRRATLNASGCGIVDNGDFNDRGTVSANTFAVSGNASGRGGRVTCTTPPPPSPCPSYGTPATSDPLAFLTTIPPPLQAPLNPGITTSGVMTLQPGTYPSISIGTGSTVTFAPGIYYINGPNGLSIQGTAAVQGAGVMFYFTFSNVTSNSATVNIGSGTSIQLSAPTTGTYAGILMYQDPADTKTGAGVPGPTIGAQDNSFFDGALYFPVDKLTFNGNAGGPGYKVGVVVANSLVLNAAPTVNMQGSAGLPPGVTLIKATMLVE